MNRIFTTIFLSFLALATAIAAPLMTVEINGEPLASGSSHLLDEEGFFEAADPLEFNFQDEQDTVEVAFPNIPPGRYIGQSSSDGNFWSHVTPLIIHPSTDFLTFSDQPGPVVTVFYRIVRVDYCAFITIRNDGDMPLTNIAASLSGPDADDFSLDLTFTEATLNPGNSTFLSVCFSSADADEHLAVLNISSNNAPYALNLIGDNEPGPSEPQAALGFGSFELIPATPTSAGTFTGNITGPPNTDVILQGSADLGAADNWGDIVQVTLDAAGAAVIASPVQAGTAGSAHYFLRLVPVP